MKLNIRKSESNLDLYTDQSRSENLEMEGKYINF